METLTTLSARSLQYYIIARRWSTELEFFNIENGFFKDLLNVFLKEYNINGNLSFLALTEKLKVIGTDMIKAETAVAEHLNKLELIAENKYPELQQKLATEQACIEYLMLDVIHEFRQLKVELFETIRRASKADLPMT